MKTFPIKRLEHGKNACKKANQKHSACLRAIPSHAHVYQQKTVVDNVSDIRCLYLDINLSRTATIKLVEWNTEDKR